MSTNGRPNKYKGPTTKLAQIIDTQKYRIEGESFNDKVYRVALALSDDIRHEGALRDILGNQRFLPGGRVQAAMGSKKLVTAMNCYVSGEIHDSMISIMRKAGQAAETMRRGGGIGYDFSKLRPRGDIIKSLESQSTGPIAFMGIYNEICKCISSSGHRRGAQMAVLRVDHPNIEEFIQCKQNETEFRGFNISVGVTDEFMMAVDKGKKKFMLKFEGRDYKEVNPQELWDKIMKSTWDWAEPGVLFLDRINQMNNLSYCERITATNPCGEVPLQPYGCCLLGSFNLTAYVKKNEFDWDAFKKDIPPIVRGIDNVIDRTIYPLKEQEDEAINKRRMGLGITGTANAGEMLGMPYASGKFMKWVEKVLRTLRDTAYEASSDLAIEKGSFPEYRAEYLDSLFVKTLPSRIRNKIHKQGMRNSHLTSVAPCGTISITADNVSSGIEPVYEYEGKRDVQWFEGPKKYNVKDYGYVNGVEGVIANDVPVQDHVKVLSLAQQYVDAAVSKTCNVGDDVTYEEFKDVYMQAWDAGCKGITTFRKAGKRMGILHKKKDEPQVCEINERGERSCSD